MTLSITQLSKQPPRTAPQPTQLSAQSSGQFLIQESPNPDNRNNATQQPHTKMLRYISINVDRKRSTLETIKSISGNNETDIILIQDAPAIWLSRTHTPPEATFPDFTLTETTHNPKTWTLRHKHSTSIWKQPTEHNIGAHIHLTIAGIASKQADNNAPLKSITANIYIRPRASHSALNKALQAINNYAKGQESRIIIMGDCNASSLIWEEQAPSTTGGYSEHQYHNLKANRGRQLEKFIIRNRLWCANTTLPGQHTFSSNHSATTIDLALLGTRAARHLNAIQYQKVQTAGHLAIKVTLAKNPQKNNPATNTRHRYNLNKINQDMFVAFNIEADKLINNWQQLVNPKIEYRMNTLANKLYATLLSIQQQVKTKTGQRNPSSAAKQQNSLQKRLGKPKRRTGTNKDNHPRQAPTKSTTEDRPEQRTEETPDLWKRVRKFNSIYNKKHTEESNLSPSELDKLTTGKFPHIQRNSEALLQLNSLSSTPTQLGNEEIETALESIKTKKYTGPEGLRFATFNKSLEFTKKHVTQLCRMSFHTGKIPEVCKVTQGTLIPKANKAQFRIVHVGTPLASLMENIALHKLEHILENRGLIADQQYGFTATRGRHDLIAKILELTIKNHRRQPHSAITTVASLDVEGAFDNVNQDVIINNIRDNLNHPLAQWLMEFVLNRSIRIKSGANHSKLTPICKGVPQGSPLGPVLWNLTINKLADRARTESDSLKTLMYADDIMLVHTGNDRQELQDALDRICQALATMQLNIKAEKCAIMMLRIGKSRLKEIEEVRSNTKMLIKGQEICRARSLKILGVTITEAMKLDREAPNTTSSLMATVRNLHKLRLLDVPQSALEWKTLINSYLISTLVNNNISILAVDKDSQEWIDKTLAASCKQIFGWSTNVSNGLTQLILGLQPTQTLVMAQIITRLATEHHESYRTLLSHNQSNPTHPNQTKPIPTNIDQHRPSITPSTRKYHNPTLLLPEPRAANSDQDAPSWFIKEVGNHKATAVLILGNCLMLEHKTASYDKFRNGYCNTLTLLHQLATDRSIKSRHLTFVTGNSAATALHNAKNHDHRVIMIREALVSGGWRIRFRDRNAFEEVIDNTLRHTSSIDFNRALDETNQRQTQPTNNTTQETLEFTDLHLRNKARRALRQLQATQATQRHTSTTKALAPDTDFWSTINPAHISNPAMLTLTGLVQTKDGLLVHGKTAHSTFYKGCEGSCLRGGNTNTGSTLKITPQLQHTDNTLVHRLLECPRQTGVQQRLVSLYNKTNRLPATNRSITTQGLAKTMKNNAQWLSLATEAALPTISPTATSQDPTEPTRTISAHLKPKRTNQIQTLNN